MTGGINLLNQRSFTKAKIEEDRSAIFALFKNPSKIYFRKNRKILSIFKNLFSRIIYKNLIGPLYFVLLQSITFIFFINFRLKTLILYMKFGL